MAKKAQAAMEFLMTYGWAILVVLIAIGALAYFGVLNPDKFLPEKCTIASGSGLFCEEFTSSASANTITLRVKNILTDSAWVDSVSLDDPSCTFSTADTEIGADNTTDFTLSCSGGLTSGNKIKGSLTITYDVGTAAGDGLSKSTTGQLVGRIHYGLGRYFMVSGRGSFQVIAYEPGVVTVTNLNDPSQSVIHEFTESGEVWHQANYDYISLKIEGDIDIFVQVGFGEDRIVSGNQPYIGGRATEDGQIEYWFYSGLITTPDEKQLGGIIFAPEDVTFILNDEEISLSADEYKILVPTEKLYYVVSSEPLVIYNGFLNGFALAPSGIPATKPEVTEEPVDNTMIYVAVAVAAIVIVAVLVFILKRKR